MGNACLSTSDCINTSSSSSLVIGTLNYGGILNSPFQFFSNQGFEEEQKISNMFYKLLPIYFPKKNQDIQKGTFKWDIGKIDQKFQKERYSPLYNPKAGILKGMLRQKLAESKSFKQQWQAAWKKHKNKVTPEPTQEQVENMKIFDLICYHALLAYCYKLIKKSTFQKQLTLDQINILGLNLQIQPYEQLMQRFFQRSYLDQDKKITKVLAALKQSHSDVIFFQQPTMHLIKALQKDQNYLLHHNGQQNSMILVKKNSFNQHQKEFFSQRQEINRSKYQSIDIKLFSIERYIFGSIHLTSKKEKQEKQIGQLKKILKELHSKYPQFTIIVGGDTNTFISSIDNFHVYPHNEDQFTNQKMRTYLQPQFHKAKELNKQCKDQIFSNLQLNPKKCKICTINNKTSDQKDLLPTDKHPFDHFMVIASVFRIN